VIEAVTTPELPTLEAGSPYVAERINQCLGKSDEGRHGCCLLSGLGLHVMATRWSMACRCAPATAFDISMSRD